MRFDIPVVGLQTLKVLKKIQASVLAVEAGRAILLERERMIAEADRIGLAFLAVEMEELNSPVVPIRDRDDGAT